MSPAPRRYAGPEHLVGSGEACWIEQPQYNSRECAGAPCRLRLADGDLRLASYQRRVHTRERSLHAELRRLERERAAQAGRLAEHRLELRHLEILTERRAERIRAARTHREQETIDELALARRHCRR